jgi:hypothetical protein
MEVSKKRKDYDVKDQRQPVCPRCGRRDYNWWERGKDLFDGNTYEAVCGRCGEDYLCTVSIPAPRFTTDTD